MENRQTTEIQGQLGRPSPLDRNKAIAALELGFFSKRLSAIDDPSLRFLSINVIKVDLSHLSDEIPANHFLRLHQLLDELERLRNVVAADPELLRSLTELYHGVPIDAIPPPVLRWQEVPSEINELAERALAVGSGLWVCHRTGQDIGALVHAVEINRRMGLRQTDRYRRQVWERAVTNIGMLVQGGLRTDPWLRDFLGPAIEIEKLIKSSSLAPPAPPEGVSFAEPCPALQYPFPIAATDEKTLYEFIMRRLWVAMHFSDYDVESKGENQGHGTGEEPVIEDDPDKRMGPRWDEKNRQFIIDGVVVHTYKQKATNQLLVLEAFEAERWATLIDTPIDDSKHRTQTLKELNEIARDKIKFRGDGTGERIKWERPSGK